MNLIDKMFGEGSLEFLQDHPMAVSVVSGSIKEMMIRSATTGDDSKQMKKLCIYCRGFNAHKENCEKIK